MLVKEGEEEEWNLMDMVRCGSLLLNMAIG